MNGRVYDPAIGRFLSPDPTVQFVANLQSYNRYSYVLNNPLRYSDPTGYAAFHIGWAGYIILGALSVAVCNVGEGACLAAMFAVDAANYANNVAAGAPWDQALVIAVISFAFNYASGMVGGAVADGMGGGPWAQLAGGAVSGATSSAFSTVLGGDLDDLGENMLLGAASGAGSAAYTLGIRSATAPVTQAEVKRAEGLERGTFEEARAAERKVQAARDLAADRGEVLKGKVDGIPVGVFGGTPEYREKALAAFKRDLTDGGDVAKQMKANLRPRFVGKDAEAKAFEIVLMTDIQSHSIPWSNRMVIDTWELDDTYTAKGGKQVKFTWERIVAHELGHSALGYSDWRISSMENVNKAENPIMRALEGKNAIDRVEY